MLAQKSITFLIADDHSLIRQGVEFLIEDLGLDYEVFHASNLSQILDVINTKSIDIAITDAHFPDGYSLSILPEIKKTNPETKVLIFSGIDENTQSLKYINAGANGFISKLSEEDEVKNAILKIIEKGEYISPTTQALIMNSFRNPSILNPLLSLSERELQIAELYAKGIGNLEIANLLDLKQNTVSTVKKRIFEKLNIDNVVELVELIKRYQ